MDREIGAMDISAAGLAAQRMRLNVVAENLANAETTRGPDGGPFRRKLIQFGTEPAPSFGQALGVAQADLVKVIGIEESQEPLRQIYLPTHPDANVEGNVMYPNVNPVLEMVDLLAATRAYEANVTAIQAAKSMGHKALEIGR
jgi:flagellar basal-body rod protein FlgC